MTMQQRDKFIEEIRRIEGLMAYVQAHEPRRIEGAV